MNRLMLAAFGLILAPAVFGQAAPTPRTASPARPAARTALPPSYRDLKYPPLREVKLPTVATFTLPNGMKLYLLENHELPLVSGTALVRTGNLFDPAGKVGLAGITGTTMRTGGTKSKTGDELDEFLEGMGAGVEAGIGETSGSVSFNCLKENTGQVLAVFKDVLTGPEFRQDKIDLAKTQTRSSISRRNDDPHGIAAREFDEILYGKDTPYGWRTEYATIDAITRDDIAAFYKRYFFPANVMLAIQGDFDTAEMRSRIEKLFADWTVQQPPPPPFPPVTAKPVPNVFLAAKPDVTQTTFEIGHLGGTFRDKDYPALEVMGDILAGSFSSRLFKRVRTQMGAAYSIGGGWSASYDHPGTFTVSGSTKSASTVDAIKAVREEIERIRTSEVTDEELKTAKDTVLNSFVFNFDRPSKTLSRMLTYEYYGYPKDFIFEYQKAVAAVTKADVLRVAKQHLHPEDLTVVTVGNPKDFGTPLTALNLPVKDVDLTIPQPKQAEAKADAASLERGKQLLRRAQEAMGGADKLAAVKDFTIRQDAAIQTPGGAAMKAQQTNQWVAPAAFRQEQQLPFGKIVAVFDGKAGWLQTPQGVMPMPPPVVQQVQGELFRNLFTLLLSDRDPDRTVNAVDANTVEISDKQGNRTRVTFDAKTGLPAKETYQQSGQTVEESHEDWKEFAGIWAPAKTVLTQGGQKVAEITVSDLKINSGLKPEEVAKKP